MANLLLPVNIPQQSGTAKSSMFNLKINNGQLSTDSKGTITGIKITKMLKDNKHLILFEFILFHNMYD